MREFSSREKIRFVDKILSNPDPSCINMSEIEDDLINERNGTIKFTDETSKTRTFHVIIWDKDGQKFKCSMQMQIFEEGKWRFFGRFDDAHEFRHADTKSMKHMPIGEKFKLEGPILNKIIYSLPKNEANNWKIKLFDNLARQKENWRKFLIKQGLDPDKKV